MKKLGKLLMVLCLALALFGCSSKPVEDDTVKVGVVQFAPHPALDRATQGFTETLSALAQENGKKVSIDVKNASGESNNCPQIVGDLLSENVSLIMANATPALISAATATSDVPILGTSITVYDVAFGGTTPANVSGTSDLAPLDKQAEMILELFPETKVVGLLYCSAEPNSLYQVETIESYLKSMGIECKWYSFAEASDLAGVVTEACENVDLIYVPTDNTCADNAEAIANIVIPAGIPVIAGEEGICKGCGVATLTIDYYDIGAATGKMAYGILFEGKSIADFPVEYAPEFTYKYNPSMVELFGIEIPGNYEALAD